MYAIAVETSELGGEGRAFKTRYWGNAANTYVWFSVKDAERFLDMLPDDSFTGKSTVMGGESHNVDDVYVTEISNFLFEDFVRLGGVHYNVDQMRVEDGPVFYTTYEGYPSAHEYEEEK